MSNVKKVKITLEGEENLNTKLTLPHLLPWWHNLEHLNIRRGWPTGPYRTTAFDYIANGSVGVFINTVSNPSIIITNAMYYWREQRK